MCTTTTPAVSGPMAPRSPPGSTAIVRGSQSTNRMDAPAAMAAAAVAKNVLAGDQHLLALDTHGPQRDLDGARARVHGDGVLGADVRGEPLLELAAELAERELTSGEALVDLLEDRGSVFRREVHRSRRDTHRRHVHLGRPVGEWETGSLPPSPLRKA